MAPVDPVEESEVKLSQNGSASGHAESPTGSPHAGNPASDSVTWASTNNLQDLVAPPDMHVYNSIAGGSGHASTAFIDNSNSNYEGSQTRIGTPTGRGRTSSSSTTRGISRRRFSSARPWVTFAG